MNNINTNNLNIPKKNSNEKEKIKKNQIEKEKEIYEPILINNSDKENENPLNMLLNPPSSKTKISNKKFYLNLFFYLKIIIIIIITITKKIYFKFNLFL